MKSWNITMITGLAGVLYFFLMSLVFAPMQLTIGNQIAFAALSLLALVAAAVNVRERNNPTWRTWVGLIGALLIVLPAACFLLGNLVLGFNGSEASTLVNTLLSVSAIGVLFLLPIGIIMCLIAGFSRFYATRRVAA